MSAIVTTLDREIAREERLVGIPTDQPLTDGAITHRRLQIAVVLLVAGLVAVFAAFTAVSTLQLLALMIAATFGLYALEKDRHLRRLTSLHGDVERISFVVAGELLHSGVLRIDAELVDVCDSLARAAGRIAAGLADALPADCTRVRLTGPAGEVPLAAERDLDPRGPVVDLPSVARDAVRARQPMRATAPDGRTIVAVPLWRRRDIIGVLEAVSRSGVAYTPEDAALIDAYGRGAIAALLASPAPASSALSALSETA
jgi:hypothetical protein